MKKFLPIMLVAIGFAIAAISYFGYQAASRPSDMEVIRDVLAKQRRAAEDLATLAKQPPAVPVECRGITSGIFFHVCELDPNDPSKPVPNWEGAGTAEDRSCVAAAFHQTSELAFRLQQRKYTQAAPSSKSIVYFSCDVSHASLYMEGSYDWADANTPLDELLTAYFKDRAETIYGAKKSYE